MKPNFALSLSFDGIRLLHRAGPSGWHLVGEVALECDDLSAELAALREKAAALDASGLSCKLIIPDDQIRYLDLPAKSAPYGDYDAAAAEALDGATPYALEELAFDWNVEGARLYVAAVARETLQEAENFAADHGFNPVSFVARPEEDGFGTEPFFGETTTAAGSVERDAERVEIIGAARLPEPAEVPEPVEEAVPAPAPEPEQATPPEPEREPAPEAEPAPNAEAAAADSAPEPEGEPEEESAVAFTSIRAERDAPATGAPTLAGAARAAPEMVGPGPDEAQTTPGPAAASLAPSPESGRADTASGDGGTIGFFSRRARRAEPVAPPPVPRAEPGFFGIEDDAPESPDVSGGHATGLGLSLPEDEAERMTIFGARSAQRGRPGKPRFLGLILTAALLLLMVGVAAWAAIFPESGVGRILRGAEPQIAITPEIPEIAAPASVPEAPDLVVEDPVPEVAPPVVTPEPEPEIVLAPEPGATADIPEPPAGPLTPEEARARYAVTGIWQTPPAPPEEPEAGTIDDFYLTSIDEDVPVGDAVALPAVPGLAPDARPVTPAAPAPPGTEFTLDARGLVVATPEGALTPDGVVVRAGPPPVIPPETPARAVPVPGLELTAEAAAELERLSDIRPRSRPSDLIEQQERGALGGRTRTELSGLRPRPRPASIVQAAATPVTSDPDAVAAAVAEAVEEAAPEPSTTPQAVAASLKPRPRPGNFERIVRQAPQQSAAAATVAPRIPSSASVARSATDRNAINMRQVNLIGVYGSPSNRRALVRLSNGRYQKVQVGDRMDGGRVSAIGDSELRYNKRGRDVVLRMPKG